MQLSVIKLPDNLNEKYSNERYLLYIRDDTVGMSVILDEKQLVVLATEVSNAMSMSLQSTKTDPLHGIDREPPTIPKGNETIVLNETSSFNKPPR